MQSHVAHDPCRGADIGRNPRSNQNDAAISEHGLHRIWLVARRASQGALAGASGWYAHHTLWLLSRSEGGEAGGSGYLVLVAQAEGFGVEIGFAAIHELKNRWQEDERGQHAAADAKRETKSQPS